ncbi:MAG: peptidoglycan editing factor PgeF [candidate division WOR-3 bacterium]
MSAGPRLHWRLERRDRLVYFRLPIPGLTCVFTTRTEGASYGRYESLNMAFGNGDKPERVRQNYERLRGAFGLTNLVTLKQQHAAQVLFINYDQTPAELLEADALFTDRPGLALGIKVADCLPVYVFSPSAPVVGLAHAGWRGTRDRIVARLVAAIQRKLGIPSERLYFAFGPCIGPHCYQVGADVQQALVREFGWVAAFLHPLPASAECSPKDAKGMGSEETPGSRWLLDLKQANRQLLVELGLKESGNLERCTHCVPSLFFSARRDGTTGRNLALILRH